MSEKLILIYQTRDTEKTEVEYFGSIAAVIGFIKEENLFGSSYLIFEVSREIKLKLVEDK